MKSVMTKSPSCLCVAVITLYLSTIAFAQKSQNIQFLGFFEIINLFDNCVSYQSCWEWNLLIKLCIEHNTPICYISIISSKKSFYFYLKKVIRRTVILNTFNILHLSDVCCVLSLTSHTPVKYSQRPKDKIKARTRC